MFSLAWREMWFGYFGSVEEAGAAVATELQWPGFCIGEWRRSASGNVQVDECTVYPTEAQRDERASGMPVISVRCEGGT